MASRSNLATTYRRHAREIVVHRTKNPTIPPYVVSYTCLSGISDFLLCGDPKYKAVDKGVHFAKIAKNNLLVVIVST